MLLLSGIGQRRDAIESLEQSTEGTQAFKPDGITHFRNRHTILQEGLCFLSPYRDQVLVWRSAIDAFKLPDEMKFGRVGFVGDVVEVDGSCIVCIDEKLGLHKSSVEEYLGISVGCHRWSGRSHEG